MLAANILLNALLTEETDDTPKNCNDDHDFSKVLEFYKTDESNHNVMCSDGIKRNLYLDSQKEPEVTYEK